MFKVERSLQNSILNFFLTKWSDLIPKLELLQFALFIFNV